jgi:two-component system sensor histidine kinase AtoS
MRIKAILGFIVLTILFLGGGIYITSANNRSIRKLENVINLSEVAHRRSDLMNKIKLVQVDLLIADSPHATAIDEVLAHGEEMQKSADSCFNCHHSEEMLQRFAHVQNAMQNFLKHLSRTYTVRANRQRVAEEITRAFESGERLYAEVANLSILSAQKIPHRIALIREEITRTKDLLMTLVVSGPIVALVLIFIFVRRFTTSISVLTTATERIKEGDLTHTITKPLHDEFQELAAAFNQMAVTLKDKRHELLAAESRYKTLFESAVDAIFILEATGGAMGVIVAANQAAADMHGYTVNELVGLKMQDLLDTPGSPASSAERFLRLLSGEKIEGGGKHRKKDGTVFPVEFSAGLLEIQGRNHVLAFYRDISLRLQTEEALLRSRQLATVGQMAAGLAHEIKNPLAGIKVSMEVLINELDLTPQDREIFLRIVKEILRIETLLRNLLNYARPPLPTFWQVDLNAQLENCIKNAEMILKSPEYAGEKKKHIVFTRNLAEHLPMIYADASQLQQIFLNLCLNAIEAIPGDGAISMSTRPGPDNTVVVEVSDTGKGMSPAARAEIFTPFFTTKPRGSGLGLAITSRLVELHQGNIEVVSVPGQGTTFLITFPVEQKSAPEDKLP